MALTPTSSHGGAAAGLSLPTTVANATASSVALVIQGAVGQSQPYLWVEDDSVSQDVVFAISQVGSGQIAIVSSDGFPGDSPLTLIGDTSQTAKILGVYLHNTLVGGFNAGGYFTTLKHAAPADGALAAGECALWFDQTNGAAKLMAKGKTADGTVVAASVAMA